MASVKGVCIVALETVKRRIKHFPARDDDNVEAGFHLVAPEHLTGEALGAIAID